jgi:hypothetical protein
VWQELFTQPEHLSSPPGFRRVRVVQSLVFYVVFSISLCVLLVIVLSVLLRLTGPDYTFGISKHFFLYVGMKKI